MGVAVASARPHANHICTKLQTHNHGLAAPHHSIFYRPDALPDAQPTVWKHEKGKSNIRRHKSPKLYTYFTVKHKDKEHS